MQSLDFDAPAVHALAALLGIGLMITTLFLWLSKNAALKRRLFPWLAMGLGVIFGCIPWAAGFPPQSFYTFGPLIAINVWLQIRAFQFCEACGSTTRSRAFFSRARFCSKCGASLAKHVT